MCMWTMVFKMFKMTKVFKMLTLIQLGMEWVRGPRKFQLMMTTVTRILSKQPMLLCFFIVVITWHLLCISFFSTAGALVVITV